MTREWLVRVEYPTRGEQLFIQIGTSLLAGLLVLTSASCAMREPPLSPEDALETFQLPPGFRIELVAAEPEIADPVAMAFDPQGRLYVVEMPDYPLETEPEGRVKILRDRDADGRFERSTVFADQLHFPSGVMPWREGVLVTSAPDILYLADTDGDGRADVRKVVLTGFAKTNPQLRVNGLQYAIDNWVYVAYPRAIAPVRYREFADLGAPIRFPDEPGVAPAEVNSTDVRFRPARKKVEAAAGNSEFGNAFDAWGNRFTVWNNDHVRHVVVANRYLTRNPYLSVASVMQSASDHENAARVYLIADSVAAVRDSEKGSFTSAAGISVYTGGAFPPEYEGSFFVCEPAHHLVHHDLLTADGSSFFAKRSRDGMEFLASTDGWFSPAFTTVGPDGALYVVDYYRPILEHPEWIPPEQLQGKDLYAGNQHGRIYRVVHESAQAGPAPRLGEASSSELVEHLSKPNMWWRITAQRLLVERGDEAVVPALTELASNGSELARLHALWTLEGFEALSKELVLGALADPSARIRENAIRLAEGFLSVPAVKEKLYSLEDDPDAKVQFQLALTLGDLREDAARETVETIGVRHIEDRWFQIAVLTSAAETAGRWWRMVADRPGFLDTESEGKREFIRRVTLIMAARQSERDLARVLERIVSDDGARSAWWRTGALSGMAEGIPSGTRRTNLAALKRHVVSLLVAQAPEVRDAALKLAAKISLSGTPALRGRLRKAAEIVLNEDAATEDRVYALRILALGSSETSAPVLKPFLAPQHPEPLRMAAIEALGNLRDPTTGGVLLDSWRTYTGAERDAALEVLFQDGATIPALLDAIESEQVQAWSLSAGQRHRLLRSSDPETRGRAEKLFGESRRDERRAIYESYLPALRRAGDARRGRSVFDAICTECHQVGAQGFAVGPDLQTVASRNKEHLLQDILLPNESIESGYEEYLIETTDGRSISGLIATQTPTTLVLRRAKGQEDAVLRSSIAEMRSLSVSAMPEDVEKDIDVEEMADLLAYLKSL